MQHERLRVTTRRLLSESRALEAVHAFNEAGVDVRVVKGLALQAQLYDRTEIRPYCDIDLLVDPRQWDRARGCLHAMGYSVVPSGGLFEHPIHSVAYRRTNAEGVTSDIDLHHRFHGVHISSRAFWRLAASEPVSINVGDTSVLTTSLPVTGFHLAVSILGEYVGKARHFAEWHRFCDRYPDRVPEVRGIAALFGADNELDRALALAAGIPPDVGPKPVPAKISSLKASAWLSHMRRAPSLRARATLVREVASDAYARRHP